MEKLKLKENILQHLVDVYEEMWIDHYKDIEKRRHIEDKVGGFAKELALTRDKLKWGK